MIERLRLLLRVDSAICLVSGAGVTTFAGPKAFFEGLGFTTSMDAELQPGFRWIELDPPGNGATLSLIATGDELPTGIDTGIRLVTPDARTAHRSIADAGLEVGELLDWESVPLMFSFVDFDGNRFYVSQDG